VYCEARLPVSQILDEIRNAYGRMGIEIEGIATYGTYYRLRCGRCAAPLGSVGDKLLPGMADQIVDERFELYARGLLGCKCGFQMERASSLDPQRAEKARAAPAD
jgi:hypothetical protein